MATRCPNCGKEMIPQFGEELDLYYADADDATYLEISVLWACHPCPGPEVNA